MVARLRTEDLAWQELDDEIIVLDLQSSTYFIVNSTGARLWERLASEEATPGELAAELCAVYALPAEVAAGHVEQFLQSLERIGLLEI